MKWVIQSVFVRTNLCVLSLLILTVISPNPALAYSTLAIPTSFTSTLLGTYDVILSQALISGTVRYERQIRVNKDYPWSLRSNRGETTAKFYNNPVRMAYRYLHRSCFSKVCPSWINTNLFTDYLFSKIMNTRLFLSINLPFTWNASAVSPDYGNEVFTKSDPLEGTISKASSIDLYNQAASNAKYSLRPSVLFSSGGVVERSTAYFIPTEVKAEVLDWGDITLSWSEIPSGVSHYEIEVSINNSSWGGSFTSIDSNVNLYDQAEGLYMYRVRACYTSTLCYPWAIGNPVRISALNGDIPCGGAFKLNELCEPSYGYTYYIKLSENSQLKVMFAEGFWFFRKTELTEKELKTLVVSKTYNITNKVIIGDSLIHFDFVEIGSGKTISFRKRGNTYVKLNLRNTLYMHTDLLGSPVAETDTNGVVQ